MINLVACCSAAWACHPCPSRGPRCASPPQIPLPNRPSSAAFFFSRASFISFL
ncbi:hypothetical protein PF008_g13888 [Phytophthora fragariae]|uniref:Uncharacterized protein n=1 Tax=Phytophthora fragariae TaxID=53985 RepID=A0A6G0RK26_9STRA|nr:hypothetical protein PF008_g13888 [Phytophthora fragariae]